jgi:hypothetical protein
VASDAQPPDRYGWIAAAAVTVLAGLGTLWRMLRKGKTEDTSADITTQNRIIKGHERYAGVLETRLAECHAREAKARSEYDAELRALKSKLTTANIERGRLEARNADLETELARIRTHGD